MKIAYITTTPKSHETDRLGIEARKMGHGFDFISLANFEICIDKEIKIAKLTSEYDLIIVRSILSSIKSISAIVKNLRKAGAKVFDNNFLDHEYSINKITDIIKLASADVTIPKTCSTGDFDNYFKHAQKLGYPLIVKSTRAGKGMGVYKADNEQELAELINEFTEKEKKPKNFLLQEFIPYTHDIRALVVGDEVYAMERIPAEGEFRANFSLGGSVQLFDLDDKAKTLAKRALAAINMTIGGVDILMTKDGGRYILEVNHNAGFEGMEKATGANIAKVFLEHSIEKAR